MSLTIFQCDVGKLMNLRNRAFLIMQQNAANMVSKVSNWKNPIHYGSLTLGVPREVAEGEKRVAQTPESVSYLVKQGFKVLVEKDAGTQASLNDAAYRDAGANIVQRRDVWKADIVVK